MNRTLYFVQRVSGGPIKIGYSVNVPKRIEALEKKYGRLVLLAMCRAPFGAETGIHKTLSDSRVAGEREWFEPNQKLDAVLARIIRGDTRWLRSFAVSKRKKWSVFVRCLIRDLGWSITELAYWLRCSSDSVRYWIIGRSKPHHRRCVAMQWLRRRLDSGNNCDASRATPRPNSG